MSRKPRSFDESFQRALKATKPEKREERAPRSRTIVATPRRFIGQAQIDLKYKDIRTDGSGKERPWYVAKISIGRLSHKISLGAPADWKKNWQSTLDDSLIDELAVSAIKFALDEEDDDVTDDVTAAVKQATKEALKEDGTYTVRQTI